MQVSGNRVEVSGALTLDTAASVMQAGRQALSALSAEPVVVFDLGQVAPVDSSALAVVFAWARAAQASQRISLANPSQELLSLAAVYGVGDLLPSA